MTLEKALRWVVLIGVFLLPFIVLYVSRTLFFPFITGKNFAFRIIVELIAGSWLALAAVNPAYRPKRTWLLYAFALFVAVIGIADIFGTYPHKSIWSNYERMEGWVTLAHLFIYFVVAQSVLSTERLWKNWWHTSLAVSALVGLYGIFQLAGFITINQGGIRLDATFGNATYLGVYMMFHIFIAALFWAKAWVEEPQKRALYSWLYGALIALNTYILFFTATRGAMLGLLGGATLASIILIALQPRSRVAWRLGTSLVGVVVLAGIFWVVKDQQWVHNIEPLHRLAIIDKEGIPDARQMNWNMAIQGFKERPILGWGQENFAAVFDKYYDPAMYAQEPWFDRVHNIIFDWLIAGGILGLIAYLSLHALALMMIWRKGAFAAYEKAILTGLLAGYFFYLLFTFDNITSYLFFVSLLAFITVRAYAAEPLQLAPARMLSSNILPVVAFVTVLGSLGTAWYVNADAIAQNKTIIQGISPQAGGINRNLEHFKTAVAYDSVGNQEAREQFVQAGMSVVAAQGVAQDLKQTFVITALDAMKGLIAEAPQNARFPFFAGIMLDHAGAYPEAKEMLLKAKELSPRKQAIIFELGLNALARGANDEAVQYFKEAYELAPEFDEAKRYYIAALVRVGRDAEAEPLIQEMIQADTAVHSRIASAFATRNRYDRIVEIWSAHLEKQPNDSEARFVLAGAYYTMGNKDLALQELQKAKELNPAIAAQADSLIQQVLGGAQ